MSGVTIQVFRQCHGKYVDFKKYVDDALLSVLRKVGVLLSDLMALCDYFRFTVQSTVM